jgi:hypothetical protein
MEHSMNNKRDPLQTSFYDRAVRTKIGGTLRVHWDVSEPIPDALLDLLTQLDDPPAAPADGTEHREAKKIPNRNDRNGEAGRNETRRNTGKNRIEKSGCAAHVGARSSWRGDIGATMAPDRG